MSVELETIRYYLQGHAVDIDISCGYVYAVYVPGSAAAFIE